MFPKMGDAAGRERYVSPADSPRSKDLCSIYRRVKPRGLELILSRVINGFVCKPYRTGPLNEHVNPLPVSCNSETLKEIHNPSCLPFVRWGSLNSGLVHAAISQNMKGQMIIVPPSSTSTSWSIQTENATLRLDQNCREWRTAEHETFARETLGRQYWEGVYGYTPSQIDDILQACKVARHALCGIQLTHS